MADVPSTPSETGELYLDAATIEPVSLVIIGVMTPFLTEAYTNPVSVHQSGKTAARVLGTTRVSSTAALGTRSGDVIFTSDGTESDNLATRDITMARIRKLGLRPACGFTGASDKQSVNCYLRITISAIEHPTVTQSAVWLHGWLGFEVIRIPVNAQVHLDLGALERELDDEANGHTTMVSTVLVSDKVGTVEPVEELVRIAHVHGVPTHVNTVQATGQIPICFRDQDMDALSVSGHKFGTPKGLGALLVRDRVPVELTLPGGGQERGLCFDTQNMASAMAPTIELNESSMHMQAQYHELVMSRDILIDAIRWAAPHAGLTGNPERCLPGHASFIFPGVIGEALFVDLGVRGIVASSDSVYVIGRHEISATSSAVGLEPPIAKSALRMAFHKPLAHEQIEHASLAIEESYTDLTHH